MRSSTELEDLGFPLARVPDQEFVARLGIAPAEVAARRKLLTKQQRDPAWIAETLEALPAATLAVLHLLVEHGGVVMQDFLFRLARDAFGMSELDCTAAATPAIDRLVAVPLTTQDGRVALGIMQPAALLIAPLVAGLELLALPADKLVPTESPVRNPRAFLAICVATRHADVKLTNEGRPHRSATKRLAKQVGLDDDSVEAMLMTGFGADLVNLENEVLRPDVAALVAAAGGVYPPSSFVATSRLHLAAGPLPVRALIQAVMRHELDAAGYIGFDAFGQLPGFATGTIDGAAAVMLQAIDGVAAGHVTPSFEVFLPPESRLLDIVHIGACCEWERLDRVIVGRITKASVARAVAGGSSAMQILEHLAAASRHPIPQNVEAAIRDWAGSLVAATIATGQVVVVDPSARGRVAPVLAELGARELAPGVFLVDRDASAREIAAALGRVGVYHRELGELGVKPASVVPASVASASALVASPVAARVRARVAAWRRGEPFEGKRDDFVEQQRAAGGSAAVDSTVEQALTRWARKHHHELAHGEPIYQALVAALRTLPAATRARLFATTGDLGHLIRELSELAEAVAGQRSAAPSSPRGRRRVSRRPPPLLWQEDELLEQLRRAAQRGSSFALQLANGIRYVELDQVLRRGNAWLVLGEDIRDGAAVAVRIDEIRAIAALPDSLGDYDLGDDELGEAGNGDDRGGAPRKPWHPAPDQPRPPGHLPCPCGSGSRYRNCCRDAATA